MAIALDPTQAEARRLVGCLVGYWLLFAVALLRNSDLLLLLMLPAAALLLFFFWIVLRIVSRETGRPLGMYLNPFLALRKGRYWEMAREGLSWQWKLLSPRWIGRVVRRTGWNFQLTIAMLVISLCLALLGLTRSFNHSFSA